MPLGRIDAIAFTGGIGENSTTVRRMTIARLGFLGLTLDADANATHGRSQGRRITTGTRPKALIVPTNEELMIAEDAERIARAV